MAGNTTNKSNIPFFKDIDNLLIIFVLSLFIIFYFIAKNDVLSNEPFLAETTITSAETTTTSSTLSKEDIVKLQKELEEGKIKMTSLTTDTETLKKKLETIKTKHADLKVTTQETQDSLNNDIKDFKKTIKQLQIDIDNYKGSEAELKVINNGLRSDNQDIRDATTQKIKTLNSKIETYKSKIEQLTKLIGNTDKFGDTFKDTIKDTTTTTQPKTTRAPLPSMVNETVLHFSNMRKLKEQLTKYDASQNEKLQDLEQRFQKLY